MHLLLVSCPPGTYYNATTATCSYCPIGTYQDQPEQSACVPCGTGLTTALVGMTSSSNCYSEYESNIIPFLAIDPEPFQRNIYLHVAKIFYLYFLIVYQFEFLFKTNDFVLLL